MDEALAWFESFDRWAGRQGFGLPQPNGWDMAAEAWRKAVSDANQPAIAASTALGGTSGGRTAVGGWLDGAHIFLNGLSIALDATGFGAAVSWAPDLVDAVISAGEGDWTGASISIGSAVPGFGVVGNTAKLGRLAAKTGGGGTTRLFRAVEPEELADVMRYGDYNIHPNSIFKRFAFDEGSLDAFIKANPGRNYTKTFIDVPTENLNQMYRHADPGGVGRSIGIDVYENPSFYNWFDKVNILGK